MTDQEVRLKCIELTLILTKNLRTTTEILEIAQDFYNFVCGKDIEIEDNWEAIGKKLK